MVGLAGQRRVVESWTSLIVYGGNEEARILALLSRTDRYSTHRTAASRTSLRMPMPRTSRHLDHKATSLPPHRRSRTSCSRVASPSIEVTVTGTASQGS